MIALNRVKPDNQFMITVSQDLKDELLTWVNTKYVTTKKSWLEKGLKPVSFTIWTDASSGAAGIKIAAKNIEETVYWTQDFNEDSASVEDAIMLKEAYAVLYTLRNYGHILKNSRVLFQQDNKAVSCSFYHGCKNSMELTKYIRQIMSKDMFFSRDFNFLCKFTIIWWRNKNSQLFLGIFQTSLGKVYW